MRACRTTSAATRSTAGPLRVHVTDGGVLRIGWDEPDWLGPARLVTPDAVDRRGSRPRPAG